MRIDLGWTRRPAIWTSAMIGLTSCVGFLAQVALFRVVGIGAELDRFFRIASLPLAVVGIAASAVVMVLVPEFVSMLARPDAEREVRSVLDTLTIVAIGVTAFGVIAARAIYPAPDWPQALSRACFWAMAGLGLVSQGLCAYHYAIGKFVLPAASAMLLPAGLIVGAMAGYRFFGVAGVAACYAGGAVLQTVVLLSDRRVPSLFGRRASLRHGPLFAAMAPVTMAVLPNTLVAASDAYWTRNAPAGLYSSMSFSLRLTVAVAALITTGVATVGFPRLSALADGRDWRGARMLMARTLSVSFFLTVSAGFLLFLERADLVEIVARRRGTSPEDTRRLVAVIGWYLIGMVAQAWSNVTIRGFYAYRQRRPVAIAGVVGVIVYFTVGGVVASAGRFALLPAAYAVSFTVLALVHSVLLDRIFQDRTILFVVLQTLPSVAVSMAIIGASTALVIGVGADGWTYWARLGAIGTLSVVAIAGLARAGLSPVSRLGR